MTLEEQIPVLFAETDGVYFNDPRFDPWDINKNALLYRGDKKVIAHPPCKRWGRYWGGGPSAKVKRFKDSRAKIQHQDKIIKKLIECAQFYHPDNWDCTNNSYGKNIYYSDDGEAAELCLNDPMIKEYMESNND
jgi:hypothetical protein